MLNIKINIETSVNYLQKFSNSTVIYGGDPPTPPNHVTLRIIKKENVKFKSNEFIV